VYWEGKVLNYMYPTSLYREEGSFFPAVSAVEHHEHHKNTELVFETSETTEVTVETTEVTTETEVDQFSKRFESIVDANAEVLENLPSAKTAIGATAVSAHAAVLSILGTRCRLGKHLTNISRTIRNVPCVLIGAHARTCRASSIRGILNKTRTFGWFSL
jgi:hypothetical protein